MGVLSWGGLVAPKFSTPLSGETLRQTRNVLEVQEHAGGPLSPCQVWWGSDFTRRRGGQKRGVFLSVSLSVRHAFERQSLCAQFRHEGVGVQKRFWCRWIGERFLILMPIGDITKCQSPKTAENGRNWGFSPPEDDRIIRSRQNFAGKRRPWVCYSSPNLALIGKRGLVQESPNIKNCPKLCFFWPPEADTMNTFR